MCCYAASRCLRIRTIDFFTSYLARGLAPWKTNFTETPHRGSTMCDDLVVREKEKGSRHTETSLVDLIVNYGVRADARLHPTL